MTNNASKKLAITYLICFAVLLFGTYPLAIIPPGFVSLLFHISIPSTFILTLFAIPIILHSDYFPTRRLRSVLLIYLTTLVFNVIWFKELNQGTIQCLSYVIIPWIAAVLVKQKVFSIKHLVIVGSLLWCYHIFPGFRAFSLNEEIVGLSGNRNWTSSLLLALIPWPIYALKHLIPNGIKSKIRLENTYIFMSVVSLLIILPTLFLVYKCSSRGAWLALVLFGVFYLSRIINRFITAQSPGSQKYLKFGIGISLFTGCFIIVYLFFVIISSNNIYEKLERSVRSDVRLPLWISSVRMMKDNDLFLSSLYRLVKGTLRQEHPPKNMSGVGPGNFVTSFAKYRSHSTYHSRIVAAPVTIHPHNQLLYVSTELGILAGIAFCFMILPVFSLSFTDNKMITFCRYTAFIIIIHSLFDLNMIKPPGSLIALFCLGICWQNDFKSGLNNPVKQGSLTGLKNTCAMIMIIPIFIACLITTIRDVRVDWHLRKGYLQEAKKEFKEAFKTYSRVVEFAPQKIRPHLYGATIAIDRLKKPELAMPLLMKAYEIDSNFAHINQMLGKTLTMTGNYTGAHLFFIRECKLFPRSAKAYQDYFNSLTFNGDFERLPVIEGHLRKLYLERVNLSFDQPAFQRLSNDWLDAIFENNSGKAIDYAELICSNQYKRALDPLFLKYHKRVDGKTLKIKNKFIQLDYYYWYDMVNISTIAEGLNDQPAAELSKNNPDRNRFILNRIKFHLDNRIKIEDNQKLFSFPYESWLKKRCNTLSYHCLFLTLANHFGFQGLILYGDHSKIESIILKNEYCYTIRADEDNIIEIPMQLFIENLLNTEWMERQHVRRFMYPQQLWLKNQILGSLINHYSHLNFPDFDRIPLVSLIKELPKDIVKNRKIQLNDLQNAVLSEPFDRFPYE